MARTHANPPVDRDALHVFLWERADRRHRIEVHQGKLAEMLDVTRGTVVRMFKEMGDAGRITKVDSLPANVGLYEIVDPKKWQAGQPKPPRRLMWG